MSLFIIFSIQLTSENMMESEAHTLPTLGESLVLVAAWSRQGGTGTGFFWISSLKQVEG